MKNLIDAYIPTIRRRPTQRVKIPCGTKKPERIKLPKPAKIDRFELPILHCGNGMSEKICALIKVAEKFKIPVSEICDSIDLDYGTNGNGIVRAHFYLNVYPKDRGQIEKIVEAIRDA